MKISNLRIQNFRCFAELEISLGPITVLTGPNNSGKSSILRAVSLFQRGAIGISGDIRSGSEAANISIVATALALRRAPELPPELIGSVSAEIRKTTSGLAFNLSDGHGHARFQADDSEPHNYIVPYYSKRKVMGLSEDVRVQHARGAFNIHYLSSKLTRINVPSFPGHVAYSEACRSILGFVLGAIPSEGGARPGRYLSDGSELMLEQMGDGVPSIAALLIELATAKNKIFLIEEPENDLHPSALKALLDLVLKSSEQNQFIVSTHSNIVVQYLGSEPGSLFEVSQAENEFPTSIVTPIDDSPSSRTHLLRKLGYTLADFDLWDGWLILEESSAERIFRDFLIPIFSPRLSSLRTLAANGTDDAEATFGALHRMVRFTHLEEVYRRTTWVRLDGDIAGQKVIAKLKESYQNAHEGQFASFSEENFERYYPVEFSNRANEVLAITDKQGKREAKRQLLHDVANWLHEDRQRAQVALATSAKELIDFLKEIEASFFNQG